MFQCDRGTFCRCYVALLFWFPMLQMWEINSVFHHYLRSICLATLGLGTFLENNQDVVLCFRYHCNKSRKMPSLAVHGNAPNIVRTNLNGAVGDVLEGIWPTLLLSPEHMHRTILIPFKFCYVLQVVSQVFVKKDLVIATAVYVLFQMAFLVYIIQALSRGITFLPEMCHITHWKCSSLWIKQKRCTIKFRV